MNNVNPTWNTLLSKIPEDIHAFIIPELEKWDADFAKEREKTKSLEAFKDFADQGINPEYIQQAIMFANAAQENPSDIVKRLVEHNNLDYVSRSEIPDPANNDDEDLGDLEGMDIKDHPVIKQMAAQLEQFQNQYSQQTEEQKRQQQIEEFEDYLDTLEEQYKDEPFDRQYVTALLMTDDNMTGEQAVKRFQETIGKYVTPPNSNEVESGTPTGNQPPLVVGSSSSSGNIPNQEVDVDKMSSQDLDKMVANLLNQNNQT